MSDANDMKMRAVIGTLVADCDLNLTTIGKLRGNLERELGLEPGMLDVRKSEVNSYLQAEVQARMERDVAMAVEAKRAARRAKAGTTPRGTPKKKSKEDFELMACDLDVCLFDLPSFAKGKHSDSAADDIAKRSSKHGKKRSREEFDGDDAKENTSNVAQKQNASNVLETQNAVGSAKEKRGAFEKYRLEHGFGKEVREAVKRYVREHTEWTMSVMKMDLSEEKQWESNKELGTYLKLALADLGHVAGVGGA